MKLLLILTLLLMVLPILLLAGALAVNRPPLLEPPGLGLRLVTYLTTNVAMTSSQSQFPELQAPVFQIPPVELFKVVEQACRDLGWQVDSVMPEQPSLKAVVTTSLFRFQDDIDVRVTPHGERGSVLHVRAASRVGKGDLAANTRHILNLQEQVETLLTPSVPLHRATR